MCNIAAGEHQRRNSEVDKPLHAAAVGNSFSLSHMCVSDTKLWAKLLYYIANACVSWFLGLRASRRQVFRGENANSSERERENLFGSS